MVEALKTTKFLLGQAPDTEALMNRLYYDEETGSLRWRVRPSKFSKRMAGDIAGCQERTGYIVVRVCGRRHYAHRLIWLMVYRDWPFLAIDHIDGNKSNNKLCNLRLATHTENNANRPMMSNNTSGFRGVMTANKGFRAQIKINGKIKSLGTYPSAQAAFEKYRTAAIAAFGEFARLE